MMVSQKYNQLALSSARDVTIAHDLDWFGIKNFFL